MSFGSYFRISIPLDAAIRRLEAWGSHFEPPVEYVQGAFAGPLHNALLAHHTGDWTVFEDVSACFDGLPAEQWLKFARSDRLLKAGWNSASGYGELIVIEFGKVVREFESDDGWLDVASLSEDDALRRPTRTWLLRHRKR